MIQVENLTVPVSLLREEQCTMSCCKDSQPEDTVLTQDHIFPKIVAARHKGVLGNLVFHEVNLIKVCRERHTQIDFRKITTYDRNQHRLSSIVEFNGTYYPRAAEQFRDRQQDQWEYLFSRLGDNISKLKAKGRVPVRLRSDYDRAEKLIDRCLDRWAVGKF